MEFLGGMILINEKPSRRNAVGLFLGGMLVDGIPCVELLVFYHNFYFQRI